MALATLDDLREAIANTLERNDLAGEIDNFIRLAEGVHRNEIRIREMLSRSALSIDDEYVALPTGYLEAKKIRILTTPLTKLDFVSIDQIDLEKRAGPGKPCKYTIHAEIEFDTPVDQTYSGEILFYKELTPLDDTNTSNALLTRCPNAYFYGALVHSAPFLMDDPRLAVWGALYSSVRDGLNGKKDIHVGPLNARVHGATP